MNKIEQMQMRLAFREEGEFVNCYLALPDTMDKSILLGSMRKTALDHEKFWPEWKDFMKRVFAAILKEATGIEALFPPGAERPAPENEKGNA